MSRAALIAACRAQVPHSPAWVAAVQALGAASRTGFAAAPSHHRKNWQATLTGILRSHHFTADERAGFLERVKYEYGSEVLYKQVTQTVAAREKAERQARRAEKAE
jgi:hypothetical protein